MTKPIPLPLTSPWPHRVAVLLVCATFPLIWVGGLVTTTDAGMAVPDWPSTYGYNLFLYPWQTWLLGPWDLFIEHGHRLLGSLVGMITIALVIAVWRFDSRRWMKWLAVGALVGVIFQGVLGGARVLMDEVQLAKLHGCVGPAFFALCVALAVFTSKLWLAPQVSLQDGAGKLHRLALSTAALIYLQLVLGAHLRHVPANWHPGTFRIVVIFHLIMAAMVALHVLLLWVRVLRTNASSGALMRPATGLSLLIVVQIALGCATWVVKYSWPAFMANYSFAAGYTVEAHGYVPALIVTAHQATGSLLLAACVLLWLRSWRLVKSPKSQDYSIKATPLGAPA